MSAFTALLGHIKSNHIAILEKYLGRELQQPNLINFSGLQNILVIKHHDSISDFLLAGPSFAVLRQAFPKARIGAVVHPQIASIASMNPNIDEVIVAPPEPEISFRHFFKACWSLRKKWDLVIVLNTKMHSLVGDLIAHFSGARLILGSAGRIFPGTRRNFIYNLIAPLWPDHIHQSEKNLDVLRYIGIEEQEVASELILSKKRLSVAYSELESKGYKHNKPLIGIHVGGGKLFGTWPLGRLAEFTRLLRKKYDAQIALFWGKDDTEKSDLFMNYVQFKVFKIAPQSTLNTVCFMKLCDAMIVNDNSAMHLGAAVGTPLVAIFGPTNPMEFKPFGNKFIAIRGQREKADNITVEQVEQSLMKLLAGKLVPANEYPQAPDSLEHKIIDESLDIDSAIEEMPVDADEIIQNDPEEKGSFFNEKLDISEHILEDLAPQLNRLNWQIKTAEERAR